MKTKYLRDIATIIMGQSPPGETCNLMGHGMPLLNGPTEFGSYSPKPNQYTTSPKKMALDGDLLFCVRGSTTGRMNWADQQYAIGRGIAAIRHNSGTDFQPYVKACVEAQLGELLQAATGSTFPNISASQLGEISIPAMGEAEQLQVANIARILADKIELNRRMNETLEQMTLAIFRDWFVDFGPVRRKQEGARDPIAIMGGLVQDPARAAELAALFPDAFGDDGLPVGWSKRPIRDVFEINPRDILKKGSIAPYSDMASLPTSGPTANPPIMREFTSGMRFRKGDALLARITPCLENGKAAYVDFLEDGEVGWGSTEFIVLRAPPPVPKPMAYLHIRQDDFRNHAIRSMTGTSGRQRATETAIGDFRISVADDLVYVSFGRFIEPFFSAIRSNAVTNETLIEARDYLLPKLISGEVRVREFEPE